MPIATTNPATGEVIKTFEPLSAAQIEQKLQLAVTGFKANKRLLLASAPAACARLPTSSSAIKISTPTS